MPFTTLTDGRLEVALPGFAANAKGGATDGTIRAPLGDEDVCKLMAAFGAAGSGVFTTVNEVAETFYAQCLESLAKQFGATGKYADAARLRATLLGYHQRKGDAAGEIKDLAQFSEAICDGYGAALAYGRSHQANSWDAYKAIVQPILAWESIYQLNGSVGCGTTKTGDYVDVVKQKTAESLAFYKQVQNGIAQNPTPGGDGSYDKAKAEAKNTVAMKNEVLQLQPPSEVTALVDEQITQKAEPAIIAAFLPVPWKLCHDSADYSQFSELVLPLEQPLTLLRAAQYCRTQVKARSKDATGADVEALTATLGGVAQGEEITATTVQVRPDGKLQLSGDVAALQSTASTQQPEVLTIKAGGKVLKTLSPGAGTAGYLQSGLELDVADMLKAVGQSATSSAPIAVTMERNGGDVDTYGPAPNPLLQVTIAFGCNPEPGLPFCVTDLGLWEMKASPTLVSNDRGDVLATWSGGSCTSSGCSLLWRQGKSTQLPGAGTIWWRTVTNDGTVVGQVNDSNGQSVAVLAPGASAPTVVAQGVLGPKSPCLQNLGYASTKQYVLQAATRDGQLLVLQAEGGGPCQDLGYCAGGPPVTKAYDCSRRTFLLGTLPSLQWQQQFMEAYPNNTSQTTVHGLSSKGVVGMVGPGSAYAAMLNWAPVGGTAKQVYRAIDDQGTILALKTGFSAPYLVPASAVADASAWQVFALGPAGDVQLLGVDGSKVAVRNLYDGTGWEASSGANSGHIGVWQGNDLTMVFPSMSANPSPMMDAHGRTFAMAVGPKGTGWVLITAKGKPLP